MNVSALETGELVSSPGGIGSPDGRYQRSAATTRRAFAGHAARPGSARTGGRAALRRSGGTAADRHSTPRSPGRAAVRHGAGQRALAGPGADLSAGAGLRLL